MAKYDFTNVTPFNEQPLYKQGYEDAINKACEWLKNNKDSDYINDEPCQFGGRAELDDLFIEEFRKDMTHYYYEGDIGINKEE